MKKAINVIMLLVMSGVFLKADLVNDYLNKKYQKICSYSNIGKYKNNEKALSIIGVACVKIDSLYLLPFIVNKLKHTTYGRKNSIYFLTILMQKKLLYSFLFDQLSLEAFSFPMTDYILSKIFEALKYGNYIKEGNVYIIIDDKYKYKLYKNDDKMFIDKYENDKLIKRRWYR